MTINIGMRGHDIGRLAPEGFAKRARELGVPHVQLALTKAIDGLDFSYGRFSPGLAARIKRALDAEGVRVSVLGSYVDLSNPVKSRREAAVAAFVENMKYARFIGADIVGSETGSYDPDYKYTPYTRTEAAYQTLLQSVKAIAEAAGRLGVLAAVEPVCKHTLYSASLTKRLLDDAASVSLGVIYDPVNLIDETNHENQPEMFDEMFALCGHDIWAVHLKDFVIENGVKREVPIGTGEFDFNAFLKRLKTAKPGVSVLLEGSAPERFGREKAMLEGIYNE